MLCVKLYPSGARKDLPEGTWLDIDVTEPTSLRIRVLPSSRREVRIGLEADPAIVRAVRSNANPKR